MRCQTPKQAGAYRTSASASRGSSTTAFVGSCSTRTRKTVSCSCVMCSAVWANSRSSMASERSKPSSTPTQEKWCRSSSRTTLQTRRPLALDESGLIDFPHGERAGSHRGCSRAPAAVKARPPPLAPPEPAAPGELAGADGRNALPNFVAVDFYDIGDLFEVVDALNGL